MSSEHWSGRTSLNVCLSFGFYRRGTVLLKPLEMTKGKTKLLFLMVIGNICGV